MPEENVRRQYTRTDLIWYQEDFVQYGHGGYHTVTLGDRLHRNRYNIRHKLGWGAFATIWLAKDTQTNRWVAVKIIRADASNRVGEHQTFLSANSAVLAQSYIIRLLDHFTHDGPNGSHLCLVFDLLGPSVDHVITSCRQGAEMNKLHYFDFLEPETIMKVSKQLLTAVARVHSLGYVHGDISTKNIGFTTQRLSKLGEADLFKVIGVPRAEKIARLDGRPLEKGKPAQLVEAVKWSNWQDEAAEDIRLFDFDGAFPQTGPKPGTIYQPSVFQAPESLLMNDLSFHSDLWSVGVVIYTLMFSITSFYGGTPALAISQMVKFVGEFPSEWQPKWKQLKDSKKHTLSIDQSGTPPIEHKLDTVEEEILDPLLPVVRGLLRMRPSERITAQQALDMLSPNPKAKKLQQQNL